jgi:hypothetical protein
VLKRREQRGTEAIFSQLPGLRHVAKSGGVFP